ncbi:MAG: 4-alpha-glucanotransferase, partial [Massilibacteroides sp.]|nr:4-alpha-glucanotransferase [Massilibacteroides sp.]
HLSASSMLTIIPLQDWLAMDDTLKRVDERVERINVPAQTNHYWRYRMHLTLEDLLQARSFNEKIRALIEHSARKQH